MFDYIVAIPLFPALGAIINGLFGYKFSKRVVHIIAVSAIGCSFALSLRAFFDLITLAPQNRIIEKYVFSWITSGNFSVDVAFLLDPLSSVMLLVVTGVGFLIHIYSTGYMHHDKSYWRFFTYLNLFVFAMLLLVMGSNFLMMFVGWEGVGLCSYLLIGFWFDDHKNASAGKKAFVVNRVGDFGFIIGMFLIFMVFGSLKYTEVDRNDTSSVCRRHGQVCPDPAVCLAAGCHGRSYSGFRAHSRGDHGHGRRIYDSPL
jgi:NADH-quinone oxidoreductase subunit L